MALAIFDLDGTLIDSKLDLANSVNATRVYMGLPPLDHDRVYSYIGSGAPVLIQRALGAEAGNDEVSRALEFFLSHYDEHKLDNTRPYPGVTDALDELRAAGWQMAVLTNKPVNISRRIVDGLGLAPYFARVYGGNSFKEKKPHPIGIEALLAELNERPADAVMVGDSWVDVRTARNAGIKACGVSYGFQPETFEVDPPDFLVDQPGDIARALIAELKIRGA
jgi:phosphoglycolate phosphatase